MKKNISYTIAMSFLLFLYSCSVMKTTPQVAKLNSTYDYSPPTDGFTRSKNISLILIKPAFAKDFDMVDYAPFASFSKAMANDYVEMLTKRGYQYIGPVNSYDEIVYSDKKNTDLLLESELDFNMTGETPFKYTRGTTLILNTPYTHYFADGEITLTGKINFFISEPFTHTKVWVKSIPIEPQRILVKSGKNNYNSTQEVKEDPQVWNAFVTALQKIYTKSLQTAWTYLEPDELTVKKKETEEIRKNSSFQKN